VGVLEAPGPGNKGHGHRELPIHIPELCELQPGKFLASSRALAGMGPHAGDLDPRGVVILCHQFLTLDPNLIEDTKDIVWPERFERKILDSLRIHGPDYAQLPEKTRTAVDELIASPRGRDGPIAARDVVNMLTHLMSTSSSVLLETQRQLSALGPAQKVFHSFLEQVLKKRNAWPGYDDIRP